MQWHVQLRAVAVAVRAQVGGAWAHAVSTHARVTGSLQFLQEHERKPAVDGLDLMSLLILPVQQLPR